MNTVYTWQKEAADLGSLKSDDRNYKTRKYSVIYVKKLDIICGNPDSP